MAMVFATTEADVGKIDERKVRQRIHDFGGIWSCIVVLRDKL